MTNRNPRGHSRGQKLVNYTVLRAYLEALGLLLELQRVLLPQLVLGALHVLALVGQLGGVLVRQLLLSVTTRLVD